jgi:hypothetical protein
MGRHQFGIRTPNDSRFSVGRFRAVLARKECASERSAAEGVLRDIAFVLHLTQRLNREILVETDAAETEEG